MSGSTANRLAETAGSAAPIMIAAGVVALGASAIRSSALRRFVLSSGAAQTR